jgi:hypothetical protein
MAKALWEAGISMEACEDAKELEEWLEKIDNVMKSTARGEGLEWLVEDELIMDEGSARTDTDGLFRDADTV